MPVSPGSRRVSSANIGGSTFMGEQPMKHIKVQRSVYDLGRALMTARPVVVLTFGFLMYVSLAVVFALLFFACGGGCFLFSTPNTAYSFTSMFYLSIHTLSTVGYGSVAPSDACFVPQLIMLIESYMSLMLTAALGGYAIAVFIRSRPKLRFSQKILLTRRGLGNVHLQDVEGGGGGQPEYEEFLTFRVITNEAGSLRDVHMKCQATLWRSGGDGSFDDRNKGAVESLALEQDYFTSIEQIQLYHKFDEKSPLFSMRDSLRHQVDGIDVALTAFDTKTGQEVTYGRRTHRVVPAAFPDLVPPCLSTLTSHLSPLTSHLTS